MHRSAGRAARARSASRACISSRMRARACTTSIPTKTYVDLNRSGVALMEIVSEPDMRSPEEAAAYLRKLRSILRYLGTCDGNMEEGSCAATSTSRVRQPGERARHALRDQERQLDPLRPAGDRIRGAPPDRGDRGGRQDRAGDAAVRFRHAASPARCAARKMRTTTAISPIPTCCRWSSMPAWVERLKATLPELPDAKKARFISGFRPLGL